MIMNCVCTEKDCFRRAMFGRPGKKEERCEIHRDQYDINFLDIVCEINKCQNYPSYGNGKRRYRCGSHRNYEDMNMGRVRDAHYFCVVVGCQNTREYGPHGEKLRCKTHSFKDDNNYTGCVAEGCDQLPLYRKLWSKINTHCVEHKPRYGYVYSKTITCTEGNCCTSARFGSILNGVKLHCYRHKKMREINLGQHRCIVFGCMHQKKFGPPGEKKVRCNIHKIDGDTRTMYGKKCKSPMCRTQPSFGPPGGLIETCSKHRSSNYVNLKNMPCDGGRHGFFCEKMPTFGKKGGKRVHCSNHADDDEINLVKKMCTGQGCTRTPIFGPMVWKRRRCDEHRIGTDVYAVGTRKSSGGKLEYAVSEISLEISSRDELETMSEMSEISEPVHTPREFIDEYLENMLETELNIFGKFNESMTFSDCLV